MIDLWSLIEYLNSGHNKMSSRGAHRFGIMSGHMNRSVDFNSVEAIIMYYSKIDGRIPIPFGHWVVRK